jgi:DNA-binding Lrp family transcriptional regulator
MPPRSLAYRIRHLQSNFSLCLQGTLYHTNIGLRKVFLIANSRPGYEDTVSQCLRANDYWLLIVQSLVAPKFIATYGIPAGEEEQFEEFAAKLGHLKIVTSTSLFWSTCIYNVNATTKWFDQNTEQWIFPWDTWLQEVLTTKAAKLPNTLIEPQGYYQKADSIDIFILKELEQNCTVKMKDIAKKLKISPELVKYHYENHVLKKQMFEGPMILANHYAGLTPRTIFLMLHFKNYENLCKLALSLMDKPFVRAVGKVYGKNQLFARLYLPEQELRNFLGTLSRLVRSKFLETYEYIIEDPLKTCRQTISYEFFKDEKWTYDHRKYLRNLQAIIRKQRQTC